VSLWIFRAPLRPLRNVRGWALNFEEEKKASESKTTTKHTLASLTRESSPAATAVPHQYLKDFLSENPSTIMKALAFHQGRKRSKASSWEHAKETTMLSK
jgi:hypothetical protein